MREGLRILRTVVATVSFLLGALLALGAILAVRFEVQGFPPRPGQPRLWYLLALGASLLASVSLPFVVHRFLFPQARHRVWALAAGAAVAALALLGVTLAG